MDLKLGEYVSLLEGEKLVIKFINPSDTEKTVRFLTYNSKEVSSGTLFVCKGAAFKKEYLLDALQKGAFAYVSETDYEIAGVPAVIVSDIRRAMPYLARAFYDIPEDAQKRIGVTGTKGKTTTCYLLRKIFRLYSESKGIKEPAFITSVETYDGQKTVPSANTTPEIFEGYRYLRTAYDNGISDVIMEVSSQGLKYDRVSGISFFIGMILNLSPDHISPIEHPDLEDYYSSKLKLFAQSRNVIVNLDSDYSKEMLKAAIAAEGVYTYGTGSGADYRICEIEDQGSHVLFCLEGEGKRIPFDLGMRGVFNIENAVAAIIAGRIRGIPFGIMQEALKDVFIPGRGEEYQTKDNKIHVIVDYAHNALSCGKLLESAKSSWPDRKIISVFGCTGGKALNRREGMGKVISALSDKIYLTTDDPGPEDVQDICTEVTGYLGNCDYTIIYDREEAIKAAFAGTDEEAVLLIMGKGCETAQKVGKTSVPYVSDPVVVSQCIEDYDKNH